MLEFFVLGASNDSFIILLDYSRLLLAIERLWYLLRSRVDTEDLMEDIRLCIGTGQSIEAMQIAKKSRGPVAAVLAAGIAHYDKDREEIKRTH